MDREIRDLKRTTEAQGFVWTPQRRGYRVESPRGVVVSCPRRTSKHRAIPNLRAKLRRAGADV